MKNVKMVIFIIWHYTESVYRASMSRVSDTNPLSFKEVRISLIKNAFTLTRLYSGVLTVIIMLNPNMVSYFL